MTNFIKRWFKAADVGEVTVVPPLYQPQAEKRRPYYTYVNESEDEFGHKIYYEQLAYVSGSISHPEKDAEFPHLAQDVIAWINKGIEDNPGWDEYRVNASFTSYSLVGYRRENDEEYAERLRKEKEEDDADAKRAYEDYLKLKELYEGTS